jgi:DNA-binding PadR family transcriptional regulator
MQFTIAINQVKALEWGLNSQQALLFSFVYECPSWAKPIKTDNGIFFVLTKAKIIEELPLLTDKPDTAYRLLKGLERAGLVELSSTANVSLFRLTEKAKEWNRKLDGSEKYPTSEEFQGRKKIRSTSEKSPSKVGKISEQGRKKIRGGSEKSPTNQDTSNQGTNQVTSNQEKQGANAPRKSPKFDPLLAKPENVSVQVWSDWCQHRKEIHKPLTAKSCEQQAKALANHPAPDSVLTLSISNGWTGIFPDKTVSPAHPLPTSRHSGFDTRDYKAGTKENANGTFRL